MGIITQAPQQHCPPRPGAQHCQAQHEHVVPTDLEVPALGPGRVLHLQRSVHLDHELPNAMVPLHRVRKCRFLLRVPVIELQVVDEQIAKRSARYIHAQRLR
jgi:hypothetical protein